MSYFLNLYILTRSKILRGFVCENMFSAHLKVIDNIDMGLSNFIC